MFLVARTSKREKILQSDRSDARLLHLASAIQPASPKIKPRRILGCARGSFLPSMVCPD
jgi:hypothetical protein